MAIDDSVIYGELCADFRSLNGFLWQMPILLMTLTGGLWLAVANFALTDAGRSDLLMFVALADLLMIGALFRLRWVMHGVQTRIRALDGGATSRVNYIIVGIFSFLLACASYGSFMASRSPATYFRPAPKPDEVRSVDRPLVAQRVIRAAPAAPTKDDETEAGNGT